MAILIEKILTYVDDTYSDICYNYDSLSDINYNLTIRILILKFYYVKHVYNGYYKITKTFFW